MDDPWANALAFAGIVPAAGTLWFFIFWRWFDYWRKHRTLTYGLMAVIFASVGFIAYEFEHWTWFGGRIDLPVGARVFGWVLVGVATVFGGVADRQIGFRVRSFTPFFQEHGHIELKTTGAYGVVRHPIYTAGRWFQLGLFFVTGYPSVLWAYVVFGLGAVWFTRQEEKRLIDLLDDPTEYERYRERVPALWPWGFRSKAWE